MSHGGDEAVAAPRRRSVSEVSFGERECFALPPQVRSTPDKRQFRCQCHETLMVDAADRMNRPKGDIAAIDACMACANVVA
jgi:hypothetical protein